MFAIKGDLIWTESPNRFRSMKDGYLVIDNGRVADITQQKPSLAVDDWSGHLIIPGLTDLHMHAPQYMFAGLFMDEELLDWLNNHTFPLEARYSDPGFAAKAYKALSEDLRKSPTTRAAVFGTIHADADIILVKALSESGIRGYAGKVNMNRNSPDCLIESEEESLRETERFLKEAEWGRIQPIITPRFIPSCTDSLMRKLAAFGLPIQSHISENRSEIGWVRELCPYASGYADAYDKLGLLTPDTIMAHAVWLEDEEMDLLGERGVHIAHSPSSNTNLSSGIAPARRFLDKGLRVGLATDVAGGSTLSMLRIVADAVQVSKLRYSLVDSSQRPLSLSEAFHMASKSSGFFPKTGSFEKGYAADAVVLPDEDISVLSGELSIEERLEQYIYRRAESCVAAKYVEGVKVWPL